ncbi:MAG: secondary thiamine-phosphate synthase enzyme YjbQ [Candidatus Aenigmarchaeota archaeon]|nr:secondary thiamine-phosphate synthase enzyme YjbQ [Candidatus Aenigmarchaeota archaeon]
MPVETRTFTVKSKTETDLIDITQEVQKAVSSSKIRSGTVTLFVQGSTASVSTIEFEPNLVQDFKDAMERIVPSKIKYRHTETWGDDNGKSHVRATLMGPSLTVPFKEKKLLLGTWQQIALFDFDVPARSREIVVQIVGD